MNHIMMDLDSFSEAIKQATKDCTNCLHGQLDDTVPPCSECYFKILGMSVNPTKWEEIKL
jgi:hypothetical protein